MKSDLTVLVTGVGGRSVGHQVLEALRLSALQPRIVATDADPFSYGLYVADAYQVIPKASDPFYLEVVEALVRREGVKAIFPGTEAETRVLALAATHFASLGVSVMTNPSEVIALCGNKLQLSEWLEAHDFITPRSAGGADWESFVEQTGFPLVAKPVTLSGGSRHLALLADEDEVKCYLSTLPAHVDVMFQEYVESDETEFTVGVLVSDDGEIMDSIVMRRRLAGLTLATERVIGNKRYALSTGYSQGYFEDHAQVSAECERLALAIGARGPVNIQCRVSDGKVYVFEVHPRFSGTTFCRAAAGFNEPEVLIQHRLFGHGFGRIAYQRDVAVIRAFTHVIVPKDKLLATGTE